MIVVRLLLPVILLFCFSSCEKKGAPKETKPMVLVSIPPYAYFVKKIADDTVHVAPLVPPGANPHVYEALPQEVQRYQNAAVWVYLGEPVDKKALQAFKDLRKEMPIVDVTQGIKLISECQENGHAHCHHDDEGLDLHIWLSPTLAKVQARHIAGALMDLLPEEKGRFEKNLQRFLKELDRLNDKLAGILAPMEGHAILVSHPGFAYFCRDYGLIQLSIEEEGKEPLPQHITEILAQARKYRVKSVLIEPEFSNKSAELVAAALGVPTHFVDPLAEDYEANLIKIAKVIAE